MAEAPLGLVLFAAGVAYAAAGWLIHRRWRGRGLVGFWLAATAVMGPLLFVHQCLQPFACDAGGHEYYWRVALPWAVAAAALALGLASLMILWRRRVTVGGRLRGRDVVLVALAVLFGVLSGYGVESVVHRLDCAAREWRRPDGTSSTMCEFYQTRD